MLNLMEFWLSYMRLKTSDTTSKSNFDSTLLLLWKLSLAFNHEYLCEFFTKFKDQWQFWNLLAMWILKLSFIFMINEELTEIFKVKGEAQLPKIHRAFFHDYIFLLSGPQPHHLQANTILLNSPLLQYTVFFFF